MNQEEIYNNVVAVGTIMLTTVLVTATTIFFLYVLWMYAPYKQYVKILPSAFLIGFTINMFQTHVYTKYILWKETR